MTLQDQLNSLKANLEKSAPKEAVKIIHRATSDLSNSGIMDGVVKTGDKAPEFNSAINSEKEFRLKDFLTKGPLVLSFYRGKW